MSYLRLFVPVLLAAAIGTANAADSTPAKLGDYQPVGFLSDYSNEQIAAYVETEIPKKYNWTHGLSEGVTSYADAYSTWAYTKEAMDIWAKHIRQRMDVVHGK